MATTLTNTVPSETVAFEDLRSLAAAAPPCITVVTALPEPVQIQTRLKTSLRDVEQHLTKAALDERTASTLAEPLRELVNQVGGDGIWGTALGLFRSPDLFRCFSLHQPVRELATVEGQFQIRPLLSLLSRPQLFYLLALSHKHAHLFRCTQYRIQKLSSLDRSSERGDSRQPDHRLENRMSFPHPIGSMKGVVFGTSRERDERDRYLHDFFKAVDRAVHKELNGASDPLFLAGVEEETALYRTVNSYPRLALESIEGSPDAAREEDLLTRARKVVNRTFSNSLAKVMADLPEYRDNRRVVFEANAVLQASLDGRISNLLISEEAELHGCVSNGSETPQDLLNAAAIETVRHKGQAFGLTPSEMPDAADVSAILRF